MLRSEIKPREGSLRRLHGRQLGCDALEAQRKPLLDPPVQLVMQRHEPVELQDVNQLLIRPAHAAEGVRFVAPERGLIEPCETQDAAEERDEYQKDGRAAKPERGS